MSNLAVSLIDGYLRVVLQDYGPQLPIKVQDSLNVVLENAVVMKRLIAGHCGTHCPPAWGTSMGGKRNWSRRHVLLYTGVKQGVLAGNIIRNQPAISQADRLRLVFLARLCACSTLG